NFNSGSNPQGVGPLNISGGTVNFSTGATVTLPSLTLSSGTLTGSDTVAVSGQTQWSGGTMSGGGTINAQGGLQLGVNDGSSHDETLDGRTFNNSGNATWVGTGSFNQQHASHFNHLSGTFDIQNDISWGSSTNDGMFSNSATVQKSA